MQRVIPNGVPPVIPSGMPNGIPAPESRMGSQTASRSGDSRSSTAVTLMVQRFCGWWVVAVDCMHQAVDARGDACAAPRQVIAC